MKIIIIFLAVTTSLASISLSAQKTDNNLSTANIKNSMLQSYKKLAQMAKSLATSINKQKPLLNMPPFPKAPHKLNKNLKAIQKLSKHPFKSIMVIEHHQMSQVKKLENTLIKSAKIEAKKQAKHMEKLQRKDLKKVFKTERHSIREKKGIDKSIIRKSVKLLKKPNKYNILRNKKVFKRI